MDENIYYTEEGCFIVDISCPIPYQRLHRLNGPALINYQGTKDWYFEGKRHRIGGPAIEYPDGIEYWMVDGKLHRADGPAIIKPNVSKEWFLDGKRHRINGPAIEYSMNHPNQWWFENKFIPTGWFSQNNIDPYNLTEENITFMKSVWCPNERG